MGEQRNIPAHVAIIMDGNGRWAEARGKERSEGHIEGVAAVRRTLNAALDEGVRYLTLYTFSTENWGRPTEEVNQIMELFCRSVYNFRDELLDNGVKVEMIGDRSELSDEVNSSLGRIEEYTAKADRLTLVIALNYSSRDEIVRAVRGIAADAAQERIEPKELTAEVFASRLDTNRFPDPDLLVRTGGEYRLSNFLLWQAAYAELYFTPTLWPDFDKNDFREALDAYSSRNRRFGLVDNKK